jgi:hypothetical protein
VSQARQWTGSPTDLLLLLRFGRLDQAVICNILDFEIERSLQLEGSASLR